VHKYLGNVILWNSVIELLLPFEILLCIKTQVIKLDPMTYVDQGYRETRVVEGRQSLVLCIYAVHNWDHLCWQFDSDKVTSLNGLVISGNKNCLTLVESCNEADDLSTITHHNLLERLGVEPCVSLID
jgi:hypothetical protein